MFPYNRGSWKRYSSMATRLRSGHPDYLNVAYYVLWRRDPFLLVTTVFNEIKNVHKKSQGFLWNICSEKQILPRFSINRGKLKISRWPYHSCSTIFEANLKNCLRFSYLIFSFHSPGGVRLFFVEKTLLMRSRKKMSMNL